MVALARAPVSRRATKELIVHAYVDGKWHRRSPGLGVTACGIPFHSEFTNVRPEQLRHPMSRNCGCFTAFELTKADELAALEIP